jgi:DNA invertase Pin-like site-specific DNA recombinase
MANEFIVKGVYSIIEEKKATVLAAPSEINTYSSLTIQCSGGHTFQMSVMDIIGQKWCSECILVRPEMKIHSILKKMKIGFKPQHKFYDDYNNKLYFDFEFELAGKKFVLDYDDKSHFISESDDKLIKAQACSILKCRLAIEAGYHVIKIDYDSFDQNIDIEKFILQCILPSEDRIFYSNNEKYSWSDLKKKINPSDIIHDGYDEALDTGAVGKIEIADVRTPYIEEIVEKEAIPLNQKEIGELENFKKENKIIGEKGSFRGTIAGYIRVSTQKQKVFGISLQEQEYAIYKWGNAKNYHVIGIYRDEGISGKDYSNREGLQTLMSDLKHGTHVVVTTLTRLARNYTDAGKIHQEIQEKGGYLVTLDMDIDTKTVIGKMIFDIMSRFSQFERDQTSERVRKSMNYLSSQKKLRSKPPFGEKYVGKGIPFEKNEEEQAVIERIRKFKEDDPGATASTICRCFNALYGKPDYPKPRKAKEWYVATMIKIARANKIDL